MIKKATNKLLKRFVAHDLLYFLDSKRDQRFATGNVHMFLGDVSQHKMPYGGRLEKFPNFKVTISGTDSELAKEALKSLSEHRHKYSETDLLCDVVNHISRLVYYFGKIYVSKRLSDIKGNEFIKIYPHNVIKVFNGYIQYVPKVDRKKTAVCIRYEKAENMFCFSIFKGPFSWLRFKITGKLLSFGDGVAPSFVMEDRFQNKTFDMSFHNQLRIRFMALITIHYAWKLRFLADEHSNEYFKIYSAYKSAIRNAQDREFLIAQLNEMFGHFKINASITLEGIPTSEDLQRSLLQLQSGEKTFRQALDEAYLL
jgi:hypothetical protein